MRGPGDRLMMVKMATLAILAVAGSAFAGVTINKGVFEGGMTYTYSNITGRMEPCFECHAYGPWGAPALAFTIDHRIDWQTETEITTLTSLSPQLLWEIGELDTDPEMYDIPVIENPDCRAAWIVKDAKRKKISVSNTVYQASVFRDENTGRNIPEVPYTFTDTYPSTTKTLYLCYGHPNGTTLGWVKVSVHGGNAWLEDSCIATGVYSFWTGMEKFSADPAYLLEGGIRQLDIFVDASVATSGDGLSWETPFKSIQEAVDAVRLDKTMIHVKPGVYGTVYVDNTKFTTNNLAYTFTVQSTDGPEKTIIDGGHKGDSPAFPTTACFWYGFYPVPLFDTIRGFTLCNSLYGAHYGTIEHCIVSNCAYGVMHASAFNCLITANWDIGFGGNNLLNCTVAGNNTGITSAKAGNSIIWGNERDNAYESSFMYATNCCIPVVEMTNSHNIVMVGPGNIMKDPCFVNAAAGDFRLRPDSPCIDTGSSAFVAEGSDLSGGKRIRGEKIDMGCYEFVPTVSDTNATHGVMVASEWLERYFGLDRAVSSDAAYQTAALAQTVNLRNGTAEGGTLSAWESYVWDLDPTDSNQFARTEITITNGVPCVNIVPASDNRVYALLGKNSLEARNWARSESFTNAAFLATNCFFKVSVESP